MIQSFRDLLIYKDKPLVERIINELSQKDVEEIYSIKKQNKENLKQILSHNDWNENDRKEAVEYAITMTVGRMIIDVGPKSKLQVLEDEIQNSVKDILDNGHIQALIHPSFHYTSKMTGMELDIESKEKHDKIMEKRNEAIEKLMNAGKYNNLRPLIEKLDRILYISAEDESNELEETDLVNKVFERIPEPEKYLN